MFIIGWYRIITEFIYRNTDDLKYLLYIGVPGGIIMIFFNECFDFSALF
jgi:hypothetical protein